MLLIAKAATKRRCERAHRGGEGTGAMRPAQPVLGVALIVGSVFLMSFGDALIKYNSAQLHRLADLRVAID